MLAYCYGDTCNQQPTVYLHEWLTLFSFYFVKTHQLLMVLVLRVDLQAQARKVTSKVFFTWIVPW